MSSTSEAGEDNIPDFVDSRETARLLDLSNEILANVTLNLDHASAVCLALTSKWLMEIVIKCCKRPLRDICSKIITRDEDDAPLISYTRMPSNKALQTSVEANEAFDNVNNILFLCGVSVDGPFGLPMDYQCLVESLRGSCWMPRNPGQVYCEDRGHRRCAYPAIPAKPYSLMALSGECFICRLMNSFDRLKELDKTLVRIKKVGAAAETARPSD